MLISVHFFSFEISASPIMFSLGEAIIQKGQQLAFIVANITKLHLSVNLPGFAAAYTKCDARQPTAGILARLKVVNVTPTGTWSINRSSRARITLAGSSVQTGRHMISACY
jgi:hypothetical protein